jgi:hypothetical protein
MISRLRKKILYRHLVQRLLAWIFVSGLIATIVVTSIQVAFEYSEGALALEKQMSRIEQTMSVRIAHELAIKDQDALAYTVTGLMNNTDIKRIEIYEAIGSANLMAFEIGAMPTSRFIEQRFNLYQSGTSISGGLSNPSGDLPAIIGSVKIFASKNHLLLAIWRRTVLLLFTQCAKALFMGVLIYYFLTVEILSPLNKLSDHVSNISPSYREAPFKLKRFVPNANDEISRLCEAICKLGDSTHDTCERLGEEHNEKRRRLEQRLKSAKEEERPQAINDILNHVTNITKGNHSFVDLIKAEAEACNDKQIGRNLEAYIVLLEQRIHQTSQILHTQEPVMAKPVLTTIF